MAMKDSGRRTVSILIMMGIMLILVCGQAVAASIVTQTIPLVYDGYSLYVQNYQEDNGKEKEPVLLVHGLTYSSHEFDVDYKDYSFARFLAKQGFEVWTFDMAGYGRSQTVSDGFLPDSDYASENIHAVVRLILDRHKLDRMSVVGWSWGTVTTGRFAALHPELVKKAVLYAPIVAGLGTADIRSPFHHNTWEDAAGDFQCGTNHIIDDSITEPAVVATFQSNCWRYDKESSPNGGRRDLCVDESKRLIPLGEIKAPVLIVAGTNDPYVSSDLCREAYNSLSNPDSRLELVEGAAHAMMMEKPYYRTFRQIVNAFLKDRK